MRRTTRLLLCGLLTLTIPASCALALGLQLNESKEELKLKYDLSVYDHDTGRVTIRFDLVDTGRLKPISTVDLHIPSKEKHHSGGFKSDLTLSMALSDDGGRRTGRIHIRKDWAERAEIRIKTGQLDGKDEPLTWYYYAIPLKELVSLAKPHKTIK